MHWQDPEILPLDKILKKIEEIKVHTPILRGHIFENITGSILAQVNDFVVKIRKLTPKGEYDVVIYPKTDEYARVFGAMTYAECKWINKNIGVDLVNAFKGKIANSPWTRAALFFSMTPFSREAINQCEKGSIWIFRFEQKDIMDLLTGRASFLDLVHKKMTRF